MFKSWKTTLAGLITGLPILITGLITQDWHTMMTGLAPIIIGALAKDHNVTGK
jgi:hypothetical protein